MKYINSENFEKIIKESISSFLSEAMPPKPIGSAPKPIGAPSPIGAAPKPIGGPAPIGGQNASSVALVGGSSTNGAAIGFKGGPTKNGFRPIVVQGKYENFYESTDPAVSNETVFKEWLDYISDVHREKFISALNQKYPDILFATFQRKNSLQKSQDAPTCFVKLIVLPDKLNDFIQIVPEIVDILYSLKANARGWNKNKATIPSYDDTFKNDLVAWIVDVAKKTPTKDEVEEANIRIAETWMELLSTLKDPATMAKLQGISGTIYSNNGTKSAENAGDVIGDNGKQAGWQLSFRNKMQIFAQDSNATFVAQDWVWRDFYNHEVIDPNKFILINHPSSMKPSNPNAFEQACIKAGYQGGAAEFKLAKKRKEVSKQEEHAVRMWYRKLNPAETLFDLIKVYDVANTREIQGQTSKFLPGPEQTRGLENNILGIPNAAARAAGDAGVSAAADVQPISNSVSNEDLDILRNSLAAVVSKLTGSAPGGLTGDAENDIVKYAYFYAKFLLNSSFQGISRPETQEAFCQGFTAAVAATMGVQSSSAADYLQRALSNRGKDSTIKQLIVQWHNEYLDLMEAVLNEYRAIKQKLAPKKKVAKASAAPVSQVDEGVDEELCEDGASLTPLSLQQFEKIFGVNDAAEAVYEEQEDTVDETILKESFFRFLDKMEHLC